MACALIRSVIPSLCISGALLTAACSAGDARTPERTTAALAIAVAPVAATEQPIARFIRVTGTLTAEAQADVAAEIAGRVVATPVERGTRVADGAVVVQLSTVETDASLKEAEANAAQIEARLALEAARQQYESAKNASEQQYQALQASRARVTLARKAVNDTTVRAPFAGIVAQRMVSVGDYVTKGMKVAEVVRITPLRIELTVPEQFVADVKMGQPVSFSVDAFPGRTFDGQVRYVSPSLRADQRALTVEASVPNAQGELKPGMFATALVEQAKKLPAVLVPAAAIRTVSGTSRVFVVTGDRAEERIVTTGQKVDPLVEITTGLKAGERVATENVNQLVDGVKVK